MVSVFFQGLILHTLVYVFATSAAWKQRRKTVQH